MHALQEQWKGCHEGRQALQKGGDRLAGMLRVMPALRSRCKGSHLILNDPPPQGWDAAPLVAHLPRMHEDLIFMNQAW